MGTSKVIDKKFRNKVKTNIRGFDEMLFGGLDLVPDHSVIVIKTDEPVQGTLLGLQMLYGIAQSLELFEREKTPQLGSPYKAHFISTYIEDCNDQHAFLNDLLLDNIISLSIQKMTEKYVGLPRVNGNTFPNLGNAVSRFFFDVDSSKGSDQSIPVGDDFYNKTDALICEEAIFYNNRTNSLHKRTLAGSIPDNDPDETHVLFHRRSDDYGYYLTKDPTVKLEELRRAFEKFLNFPLVNIDFHCMDMNDGVWDIVREAKVNSSLDSLLAIDLNGDEYRQACLQDIRYKDVRNLIDNLKNSCKLLVLMLPQSCTIPTERADMVIELRNVIDAGIDYLTRKVRISYSRRQATVLGWHIYKFRDYGLEFFPSLHTYFQERRYLQRAMIYTHSSVVTDTYQQYINRKKKSLEWDDVQIRDKAMNFNFYTYLESRAEDEKHNVESLFEDYSKGQSSVDVLENILLPSMAEQRGTGDRVQDYRGSMTAVFGDGNTYKRFITFGSVFSSAQNQEHTLIVLLNKDADTSLRRLFCPARAKRGKDCKHCHECYKYIHFMDINIGNITPEEFIYYLKKQIDIKYSDGKHIRRVVIDDLQVVDYCFPYLLQSNLFLSALVYICKEKGVYSYILCDKTGKKAGELRAVADNIVCTGRDGKGRLQVYIERFIGFHNTPSKIYCGIVEKVKDLFECYYKIEAGDVKHWFYRLNSMQIDDGTVNSMSEYWS